MTVLRKVENNCCETVERDAAAAAVSACAHLRWSNNCHLAFWMENNGESALVLNVRVSLVLSAVHLWLDYSCLVMNKADVIIS